MGKKSKQAKTRGKNVRTEFHEKKEKVPDDITMSEIILSLAAPLMKTHGNSPERTQVIISLAVTAWNLSILSETTEEKMVAEIIKSLPEGFSAENVAVLLGTVHMLMDRKRQLFHNIQRVIVAHEFRRTDKGFDLSVTSAPMSGSTIR
jgi:hypothetical protein